MYVITSCFSAFNDLFPLTSYLVISSTFIPFPRVSPIECFHMTLRQPYLVVQKNETATKLVNQTNHVTARNVIENALHYMASSVGAQEESNPALRLATRAGEMELSCPLGTTRRVPQEKFPRKPYNKSFIDQACSVKMARYWPRSFCARLWSSTPSRQKRTRSISSHLDLTLGQ